MSDTYVGFQRSYLDVPAKGSRDVLTTFGIVGRQLKVHVHACIYDTDKNMQGQATTKNTTQSEMSESGQEQQAERETEDDDDDDDEGHAR